MRIIPYKELVERITLNSCDFTTTKGSQGKIWVSSGTSCEGVQERYVCLNINENSYIIGRFTDTEEGGVEFIQTTFGELDNA